jgi:phosphonate transport system permease protein
MSRSTEPVEADGGYPTSWRRPTAFRSHRVKWAVYLIVGVFIIVSIWDIRITFARLVTGLDAGAELLNAMFPLELNSAGKNSRLIEGMAESFAMSVVATILGVAVSIPIGFGAARNLGPRWVYVINRGLITISRAFHALIVAIVVVKAVGFGPLAGVITLVFKTVGFFSKLLSEELEDIDAGQLEAVRATGANRIQQMDYAVLSQVLPRIIGLSVYRWDINIRQSTIVGIVGAGGIGVTLINAWGRYDYDFAMTILAAIIAVVIVGELFSLYLRRRVQ